MWGRVYLKPRHNCVPDKHFLLTVSSFQQKYRVGFLHLLPCCGYRTITEAGFFCPFDSHGTCKFIYRLNKPMVSRIVGLFNIRLILFFGQQDFSRFKPYSAEGQALLLHKSLPIKKKSVCHNFKLRNCKQGSSGLLWTVVQTYSDSLKKVWVITTQYAYCKLDNSNFSNFIIFWKKSGDA